jgi:hypothetical protein
VPSVAIWLLVACAVSASAQTSRIESGSTTLGTVTFYYETRLEPPVPPLGDSLNMLIFPSNGPNVFYNGPAPDTVHRVMLDRTRKVYFGYDARIRRVEQSAGADDVDVYEVTLGALTVTPELTRALAAVAESWKQLPAPKFPAPRVIRSYEVLELPLLTNDAWGQRLTEYITVGEAPRQGFDPERRREFSFPSGSPRDFSAADVMLTLTEPRVRYSRQLIMGNRRGGELLTVSTRADASGGIVWVYVPNAGRFLLSLVPRGQFVRAGSVRGTSLTFNVAGNSYNVNSATRIVPGDGVFNVYVLHQPEWKPEYPNANVDTVHVGAADRAEYLVERKR